MRICRAKLRDGAMRSEINPPILTFNEAPILRRLPSDDPARQGAAGSVRPVSGIRLWCAANAACGIRLVRRTGARVRRSGLGHGLRDLVGQTQQHGGAGVRADQAGGSRRTVGSAGGADT